ncbi:hypothetical protein, variant 4 [Aphanomyces astaci]|uniref:Protein of centriole 5 n=1 Tax=Aphanomyces astaci TaxID=112090 RepID=W4H3Q4_APHAT|nr:hypothetical protein, variant 4 [Aphanomyces astaci]ETV86620.1 hypothetical protein, variant 4 [Aphanomyces astaci]|eukprot:XP_009823418.1 hypothetical protein, variant 4 [Aphanomyces astaci]
MTSDGSDAAAVLSLRSHLAAIDLLEKDGLEEEPSLTRAYASKPTDSGNDDSFHRDSGSDVSRVDTRESLRATEVLVFPPSNEATLFSSMMEQHHTAMVQTTLALFDDLQTRLRNDHDRQINSQAAVAVEREAHAQNSLAALRTTLDDMTNRVKVQKLMLLRLATHHATKSHLHDRHFGSPQSLLRILHAWHLYSRQRMFKELRLRQAQTLHRQRMPRRPFEAWRRYTQSLQRARQTSMLQTCKRFGMSWREPTQRSKCISWSKCGWKKTCAECFCVGCRP